MRHFTMAMVVAASLSGEVAFGGLNQCHDLFLRYVPTLTPVPGHPGFVMSPSGKGLIDVRGIKANREVVDPYTGENFLVPEPVPEKTAKPTPQAIPKAAFKAFPQATPKAIPEATPRAINKGA